ncbi:MAG: enhanced serine sensitivity protein SseB C-terminal domain-containing protein [Candidatus Angelobacter sp.]
MRYVDVISADMCLRRQWRGESNCCIRREDEKNPGPANPDVPRPQTPPASAPERPDFENSALPAAMLAVAHGDSPQTRRILYESMLETWFLVPTREVVSDAPGFHPAQPHTADSFSLEHDSAGQVVAVAFTDEEALRNWNTSIPWVALQGTVFFQAVASTQAEEIVINPYEPENPGSKMIRPGGRVTRWEFESLAEGRLPEGDSNQQGADSQSVLVTMPKLMPATEMFDALGGAARSFPEILGLYFAQVIYPDGEPHWTVAVDFASGASPKQARQAMAILREKSRHVFPRTVTTDLLPASTAIGQSIKTTGRKFY